MEKPETIKEVLSTTPDKYKEPIKEKKQSNKMIIILLILILLSLLGLIALIALNTQNNNITPTSTPTPTVTEEPTISPTEEIGPTGTLEPTPPQVMKIKFYVFDSVKDPDVMICGAPSYVERNLPKSSTPLKDGINYLIHTLKLTPAEKTAGLINYFENPDHIDKLDGLNLISANISSGVGILTFEDTENFTDGGSCWSSILYEQVEFTATQFPSVNSIQILPEGQLFQP